MAFSFCFSSSATFVSTSSVNGCTSGQAYQRQSYSTFQGSGIRVTQQRLGETPITHTRLYDAQGRELVGDGGDRGNDFHQNHSAQAYAYAPSRRIISIEDVTEEEPEKTARGRKQDGL